MASQSAQPLAGTYVSEHTHSSLLWRVKHLGLSNYTGRFTQFTVTLQYDPVQIANSRVKAVINPKSVETDYRETVKDWNGELAQDAKLLDGGRFAEIQFVSHIVTVRTQSAIRVDGDMTLRGIKKPLSFDATYNGHVDDHLRTGKPAIGFSARGVFKRSDWG